jgi:cyclopropane fatty-acyl-phospholipid synthase-like methyltransferase
MCGMTRPFAQSCENNQAPIFDVLQHAFSGRQHVLEIGSGTGQHSVYLAPRLPHLIWQTSELPALHAGIAAWHAHLPAANLRRPVAMDLRDSDWPQSEEGVFDAVFTSNTLHIVAWPLVQRLLALLGANLPVGAVFAVYGPFNEGGAFTSESNRAFDAWLKARDAASGIRDLEAVVALAAQHGLWLQANHAMPANNRCLVFCKK